MDCFHKNYPEGLVLHHVTQVSSFFPYSHDSFEDDIFTEGAQYWEEVLHRRDNPSMKFFKAMTMDEKFETIEHKTQESIGIRE